MPSARTRYVAPLRSAMTDAQGAVSDAITDGPRKDQASLIPFADGNGRLIGPFALMPISPALGDLVQALGSAMRFATALTDDERELAILTVAAHERSGFEWFAHEAAARAAGLDDTALAMIRDSQAPTGLSPRSQRLWTTMRGLLVGGGLDDTQYRAAIDEFDEGVLVELVWLCGYYRMLAVALATFRPEIPLDAEAVFPEAGNG